MFPIMVIMECSRCVKKIDLINAREYANLQNEANANWNTDNPSLPQKSIWSQTQIDSLAAQSTDWQDLVYRNAKVQNHDISVSGGSAGTKYYTSLGYYDQQGIIENSGFKRYSFRTNLEQKISDKLSAAVSLSLQQSNYSQNNYFNADGNGGVPFTTMVMPPYARRVRCDWQVYHLYRGTVGPNQSVCFIQRRVPV